MKALQNFILYLLFIILVIWCQTMEIRLKKTQQTLLTTRELVAEQSAKLLTYQRMDIQFSKLQKSVDDLELFLLEIVMSSEQTSTNK